MISRSQLHTRIRPSSTRGLLLSLLFRSVAVARAVWRSPDTAVEGMGMVSEGGERDRERERERALVAGALEQRAGSDVQCLQVATNWVW